MSVFSSLISAGEKSRLSRFRGLAEFIQNEVIARHTDLNDNEIQDRISELRHTLEDNSQLVDDKDTLCEVFALSSIAAQRVLHQRPYDVQLMGGIALAKGMVAEMATGEGKTLTSIAPVVLHALTGRGVHIVTVNDYLARRDAEWMGRVFRFLGLSVGTVLTSSTHDERKHAYAQDITYVTSTELGFDYLRDNMVYDLDHRVQRAGDNAHVFALIDEADSIFIDEARTPLIIAGDGGESEAALFMLFAAIAHQCSEGKDYTLERHTKQVILGDGIVRLAEQRLGLERADGEFSKLFTDSNSNFVTYLSNAVKAKEFFHKNQDYIIRSGEVLIVDSFTGRALPGRRYEAGLHQAIEAKEKVDILPDTRTVATVTLQSFLGLYERLSGMTGTAQSEAVELRDTYGVEVMSIPTNKPSVRKDLDTRVYNTAADKWAAVVERVVEVSSQGRPVLVGTTSVSDSQTVSRLLKKKRVRHELLNAKFHEKEAEIVARAGGIGAVTVATNMAGRGTDIVLGGNPDVILDSRLRGRGLDPVESADEYQKAWADEYEDVVGECRAVGDQVRELGGLHVIGTQLHDSVRVDNQLRGRAGRQGDPGSSEFFVSLDDEILLKTASDSLVDNIRGLAASQVREDGVVDVPGMASHFVRVQSEVSSRDRESRRSVVEYDEVLDVQRREVYAQREALLSEDWQWLLRPMVVEAVEDVLVSCGVVKGSRVVCGENVGEVASRVAGVLGEGTEFDVRQELESSSSLAVVVKALSRIGFEQLESARLRVEDEGGEFGFATRAAAVGVLDGVWQSHLESVELLRDGVGLRSIAQLNPLVEYQREASEAFDRVGVRVRRGLVRLVLCGRVVGGVSESSGGGLNRAARRRRERELRRVGE